jgi:hypothetical protein
MCTVHGVSLVGECQNEYKKISRAIIKSIKISVYARCLFSLRRGQLWIGLKSVNFILKKNPIVRKNVKYWLEISDLKEKAQNG